MNILPVSHSLPVHPASQQHSNLLANVGQVFAFAVLTGIRCALVDCFNRQTFDYHFCPWNQGDQFNCVLKRNICISKREIWFDMIWKDLPLIWMSKQNIICLRLSQLTPVYPGSQLHWYPDGLLTHVPETHRFPSQLFFSESNRQYSNESIQYKGRSFPNTSWSGRRIPDTTNDYIGSSIPKDGLGWNQTSPGRRGCVHPNAPTTNEHVSSICNRLVIFPHASIVPCAKGL